MPTQLIDPKGVRCSLQCIVEHDLNHDSLSHTLGYAISLYPSLLNYALRNKNHVWYLHPKKGPVHSQTVVTNVRTTDNTPLALLFSRYISQLSVHYATVFMFAHKRYLMRLRLHDCSALWAYANLALSEKDATGDRVTVLGEVALGEPDPIYRLLRKGSFRIPKKYCRKFSHEYFSGIRRTRT